MAAATGQRYKDRVTIVTGGAEGIGFGIVRCFVQHGSKVVFADIKEERGKSVEKDLNAAGPGQCKFVHCDVSDEEQVKNLIDVTIQTYGKIDCLINNAGIHPPHGTIDDYTAAGFQKVINVNVLGYFNMSKYALPHLRKVEGNIINNASLVSQIGQLEAVTYIATKGAIVSMTKALAIDEARHNVRVNSFSPGNVFTPLWEEAAIASPDYDEAVATGRNSQLLGRFGTLEECGLLCLFLAADATFCTGIDINLSGGAELNYGHKNQRK